MLEIRQIAQLVLISAVSQIVLPFFKVCDGKTGPPLSVMYCVYAHYTKKYAVWILSKIAKNINCCEC
jgi:hypothetical protein